MGAHGRADGEPLPAERAAGGDPVSVKAKCLTLDTSGTVHAGQRIGVPFACDRNPLDHSPALHRLQDEGRPISLDDVPNA